MLWMTLGLLGWAAGDLASVTLGRARPWAARLAGPLVMGTCFAVAGRLHGADLVVLLAFIVGHLGWRYLTDETPAVVPRTDPEETASTPNAPPAGGEQPLPPTSAEGPPPRQRVHDGRLLPALACLAVPAAIVAVLTGTPHPVAGLLGRWAAWAAVGPEDVKRALLILTAVLLQCATANIVVRLVLVQVAVPVVDGTDRFAAEGTLKGGRFIGPIERILLLLLGLAGQLAAGTLITAAKGLLRFPELKRAKEDAESDEEERALAATTEYVLVGTLTSWLVAIVTYVALR